MAPETVTGHVTSCYVPTDHLSVHLSFVLQFKLASRGNIRRMEFDVNCWTTISVVDSWRHCSVLNSRLTFCVQSISGCVFGVCVSFAYSRLGFIDFLWPARAACFVICSTAVAVTRAVVGSTLVTSDSRGQTDQQLRKERNNLSPFVYFGEIFAAREISYGRRVTMAVWMSRYRQLRSTGSATFFKFSAVSPSPQRKRRKCSVDLFRAEWKVESFSVHSMDSSSSGTLTRSHLSAAAERRAKVSTVQSNPSIFPVPSNENWVDFRETNHRPDLTEFHDLIEVLRKHVIINAQLNSCQLNGGILKKCPHERLLRKKEAGKRSN